MIELLEFDYASLPVAVRDTIQQHTDDIRQRGKRMAGDIVAIGQAARRVKEQLGHGQFSAWVNAEFREEFGWSYQTLNRFMQVSQHFENSQIENFGKSALYLLAQNSTPEEAREEARERAAAGETITHQVAREIVDKHNEADESPALDHLDPFLRTHHAASRQHEADEAVACRVLDLVIKIQEAPREQRDELVTKAMVLTEQIKSTRMLLSLRGQIGDASAQSAMREHADEQKQADSAIRHTALRRQQPDQTLLISEIRKALADPELSADDLALIEARAGSIEDTAVRDSLADQIIATRNAIQRRASSVEPAGAVCITDPADLVDSVLGGADDRVVLILAQLLGLCESHALPTVSIILRQAIGETLQDMFASGKIQL